MANARIIITKSIPFRGGAEEFSNGYTFQADAEPWEPAAWDTLVDAVVAIEKAIHSNSVTFLSATAGPAGLPAALVKDLSGLGSYPTAGVVIHPEVCLLVQWRIARRRYLAKYYHVGEHPGTPAGDSSAGFPVGVYGPQLLKFTDGTLPTGVKICAPDGTIPPAAYEIDPHLRCHQFKRGRRRPPLPSP